MRPVGKRDFVEKRYILFEGLELSATAKELQLVKRQLDQKGYLTKDDCIYLANKLRPRTPKDRSVDEMALIGMHINRCKHKGGVLFEPEEDPDS